MAEKCTNTSADPSSGVMNPNPFASLNHFTLPFVLTCCITSTVFRFPSLCLQTQIAGAAAKKRPTVNKDTTFALECNGFFECRLLHYLPCMMSILTSFCA